MALQKKVKRLAAIQVMQSTDSLPAKPTLDLMPLLKTVLQQLVKKGSRGLYDLEFEDMEIDVLQSTVLLKNIKLDKNPQALNQLRSTGEALLIISRLSFHNCSLKASTWMM
jgi:hypothetical protein